MATDKDVLINFLTRLGLVENTPEERADKQGPAPRGYLHDGTDILVGEGDGYYNFYARFKFDIDGKATGHGVWE